MIYDSDNRVEDYHAVQIIELAMIHSKLASISITAGNLENASKLITLPSAILKFNSSDARQVASSKRAV